jgi:hypothetical protein
MYRPNEILINLNQLHKVKSDTSKNLLVYTLLIEDNKDRYSIYRHPEILFELINAAVSL